MTDGPEEGDRPVSVSRLWTGGAVVAVVAALVAVLGGVFARGVLGVAILVPGTGRIWTAASTTSYAGLSALAALGATGIMHALLLLTSRARRFFGWIMVLLALIAAVLPLTPAADAGSRIATAMLNLGIGLVITGLLVSVARPDRSSTTRWTGSDQYWPERQR